jgi:hypothetical protein
MGHRMFCHITNNWRGRPLVNREVVVNLIGSTTTDTGLQIRCQLDENSYETGIRVTDEELANRPLSATNSMVSGTTACARVAKSARHEAFKLFLLSS